MQMDPYEYYEGFVMPNYGDFCEDEGDVRKAFNAVVSVAHMTDNYFNYYKRRKDAKVAEFKNLKDFQIYLSKQSLYFNDIQSIANAYKHLYTNSEKTHVTIESNGVVRSVEVDNDNITKVDGFEKDDSGNYIVIYTRKDGVAVRLRTALEETIEVWRKLIWDNSIHVTHG